jgi:hypothetical protein
MSETALPESWADARKIVLANAPWILLLVAIERAFDGHYVQGVFALLLCVISLGVAIHWKAFEWLGKREGRRRLSFVLITIGAILLATGIYLLATQPPSLSNTTQDQTQLDDANKRLQAERDAKAVLDRQLAATRRELQQTQTQRDDALKTTEKKENKARTSNQPSAQATQGPITWYTDSQLLVVSGGAPNAEVNGILVMGESTASALIKEAYIVSGLTGRKQSLMANVQSRGAYYPVDAVDIPSGAPVQLDLIFKPPLPIRDFLDQWGKFRVTIIFADGTSYEREYEETYVRQKLQQMVPNAFGPRMTPREDK